jgi:arabinan endo-1,5-alpha-L-arabinosidase
MSVHTDPLGSAHRRPRLDRSTWRRRLPAITLGLLTMVLALSAGGASPAGASPGPAKTVAIPGYVFVHDPSMTKEGNTWYLFSTGDPQGVVDSGNIQIRESTNLTNWRLAGSVFQAIPQWIGPELGGAVPNLWSPDISLFAGTYHLYYAASSFGSNTSIIALATNPTLDPDSPHYHWTDKGAVFSSSATDDYNAIDPALVSGPGGTKWLLFGSFWSGIKLLPLNPATGMPLSGAKLFSLSGTTAPDAEEGAYVVAHGGYYYLFVSSGACCKGIGSSYEIIVGRSEHLTGPYFDPNGTAMTDGGGMELLGSDEGMIGPGSPSVYVAGHADLIDYHYYDAWDNGDPWIQVRPLLWTSTGWPVTGPPIVPVPGAPLNPPATAY